MMTPCYTLTNTNKNTINEIIIQQQERSVNLFPFPPYGIIQKTVQIETGDMSFSYLTTLNDSSIRKIKDYIYRFYIPYESNSFSNTDICFKNVQSIYNLSKNRQYDVLRITEKYIDFNAAPEKTLYLNTFENEIETSYTQPIDQLLITFTYTDSTYYLYQDKRHYNPILCQALEETNNQIQTIQHAQKNWKLWENWETQNNWYLNSHKQLINDTEQIIYEAVPKTNTNSKIYLRNNFIIHIGKIYHFTIKTKIFEQKEIIFKFTISFLDDTIIYEETITTNLTQNKWYLLDFGFINEFESNDQPIQISLEVINFKDKIIQFTEPQFEENEYFTQFIDGKRERKNLYYTSQYLQSFTENENTMHLYITPDLNSVYYTKENENIQYYYIKYNQQQKRLECYIKPIQKNFNNINTILEENLIYIKSISINTPNYNNTSLKFKVKDIFIRIDISKIQDENCNSIDDLFTKIYKNKFELSFLQSFNTNNKLYTQTYPYLDRSFIYPDLGNNIDGKLVETTNIHLEEINKNDEYDGEFII